jgi:hypothetical protein
LPDTFYNFIAFLSHDQIALAILAQIVPQKYCSTSPSFGEHEDYHYNGVRKEENIRKHTEGNAQIWKT